MIQLIAEILLLLVCVVVGLSCRGLHHGVNVVVMHFHVRLGHGLPLGAWWYVACVRKHVCTTTPIALLVVAAGENSLFGLLLAL